MPYCTVCGKKLKTSACPSCEKSHHSLFLQYHYEVPSNKKKQKQIAKLDPIPPSNKNSPPIKNSPTTSTARIFGRLKRSFSTSNVESPKPKQTRAKPPTKTTQKPPMFKKSPRRMNKTSSVSGLSSFYENLDKKATNESATLRKNSVSTGKKKRFTPQASLKPVTSFFKRMPSNKKKSPKPAKKSSSPKYKKGFAQKPAPKSTSKPSPGLSSNKSSTFSSPSKPFNVKKEGDKRSVSPKKIGRMTPNRPLQKPTPAKRKGNAANGTNDRGVSFHSMVANLTDGGGGKYKATIIGLVDRQSSFKGGKVQMFHIRVSRGARTWEIFRRYSQFKQLDTTLKRKHMISASDAHLPEYLIKEIRKDGGEKRKGELQHYLNYLLSSNEINQSQYVHNFLEPMQLGDKNSV